VLMSMQSMVTLLGKLYNSQIKRGNFMFANSDSTN